MMECLYLLLVVFHFTAGCTLSGQQFSEIKGRTGGSVLLPCSCTDLQTKPQRFVWKTRRQGELGELTELFRADQYRDRFQLFNKDSPANLSLLISDLREEDDKYYRCETEKESRDFRLDVKACDLMKSGEIEEVTRISGESVVLPCSCTDLHYKPSNLTWSFNLLRSGGPRDVQIYPVQTEQHRGRVTLTNQNPGNLSLHLSDLTEEDQGVYRCSVQGDVKDVRLFIKVRETFTKHPPASEPGPLPPTTAAQPAVRETFTKRPPASEPGPLHPTKTAQPAVSLPGQHSTTHSVTSAVTNLTSVSPSGPHPTTQTQATVIGVLTTVLLLLLLGVLVFICWRRRGKRNMQDVRTEDHLGLDEKQKNQTVSDGVTYSTIAHRNTAAPAHVQSNTETTEYACIKNLNT
ncbi:polymeric immunoglobulin receptor-like isoform X3 [Salminus brasiliensis]|uniref:polymeric immunoglobulin receptor-like isoform X3 n=1 Tax=Salminus brasiliensis TaxID=930266 RepID=UPI003B836F99